MTLAELLATRNQGTSRFPGFSLTDLLARRNEPLDAKFNPSGVGPGVSYGSLASILTDFAPGIGDAKSAVDAVKEAEAGNYGMSLLDAFGALPMVGGMGAIKAFHGSPHKFDAFDMSKIGTGEGAQAYGHGLYFAESPNVARQYQESLTNLYGTPTKVSGGQDSVDIPLWLGEKIKSDGIDSAISEWSTRVAEQRAEMATSMQPWIHEGNAVRLENDLAIMKKIKESGSAEVATPGALYETSLEWPDPAREAADPLGPQHFLDWDKPLSEQDSIVRALEANGILGGRKMMGPPAEQWEAAIGPGGAYVDMNGQAQRAYIAAQQHLGADAATELFKQAGIPGIRYLDQGSRGEGRGTANFVVFDDKIPRIVSRNGVSLRDLYDR